MKLGFLKETSVENQLIVMKKKLEKLYEQISSDSLGVCPIRDVLSVASDKWSILIFLYLGAHPKLRFNQLKNLIKDISSKVLSERLKRLERDGYIRREVYMEVPIKVEYQLTDFGKKYMEKILDLVEWISIETPNIIKRRNSVS